MLSKAGSGEKRLSYAIKITYQMFRNYFKVAWRNLSKTPTLTLINIIGLAAGFGFLFLTAAYIYGEWKVNSVITDNERVLVLKSHWKQPGMGLEFTTLAPVARTLYEQYPQLVENYYHHDGITSIVSNGNVHFSESLQPGDPTFLELFGFELLHGSGDGALTEPFTMILTASMARKYFGRTDVVGQTLEIQSFSGEKSLFTITGVMKDPPFNTVTNYNNGHNEFFPSAASLDFFGRSEAFESWGNPYVISYVKLREGVRPEDLQSPLREILQANTPAEIHEQLEIYGMPLRDYYLQLDNRAALRMVYTIGGISLFILLMAVVNFINTFVSNALTRLKETGLRKVMGGNRQHIVTQFLIEAILFSVLAAVAGLLLYTLAKPLFSAMLGKTLPTLDALPLIGLLFPPLTALAVGILAGWYPAVALSGQPTVTAIRGKLETVTEKKNLQRILLALQFTVAVIVFVGAVVVHQQVDYFFKSDLGYDRSSVLVVRTPRDWSEAGVQKMQTARGEFARLPEITEATFSFEIPDGQSGSISNKLYRVGQDATEAITATSLFTDAYYTDTYEIEMASGDFFDQNGSPVNYGAIILNETAAKALGWTDARAAIGEKLILNDQKEAFTVRGVIKDFHFNTLHELIRPICFVHVSNAKLFRYFSFRIKPGSLATSVSAIQQSWRQFFPEAPFDYQFMDETLTARYQNELQLKKATEVASVLALLIVLLGVIGIVLLAVTRRMKEMGIRTVLGASRAQLIWLFGKEFFWLILLANLVAWPIAWQLLHDWLSRYAYQIELGYTVWLATGILLLLLTGSILIWLVSRNMSMNPTRFLRQE